MWAPVIVPLFAVLAVVRCWQMFKAMI